jgi:DNA-binding transcriptional LysR family regulator
MSHSLRQLRERFRDPLLVKGAHGLSQTPRAVEIAGPLRRGLAELQRVVDGGAAFEPGTARRSFTMAAGDFVALSLLPDLLDIFRHEAPGIDLVIRPLDARRDVSRLESGELDLLVTVPRPDAARLRARRLFEETFVCVVREDHPEVVKGLSLETYVNLGHVLISPAGTGPSYVDAALAHHGLSRRVVLRVPYFLAAPVVVARTDLVLTAPRRVAEGFGRYFPIRLLPPPVEVASFAVHAVWHEQSERDPAQRWLRDATLRAADAAGRGTPKPADLSATSTPRRGRGQTPRSRSPRDR